MILSNNLGELSPLIELGSQGTVFQIQALVLVLPQLSEFLSVLGPSLLICVMEELNYMVQNPVALTAYGSTK